ncbi:hypothetical protein [Nocardia tengchongensis]
MSTVATTQVIHALAILATKNLLGEESWPDVARVLLDEGFRWPAVSGLAVMDRPYEQGLQSKLAELAAQIEHDLDDGARLDPWDVVAGLYGRA